MAKHLIVMSVDAMVFEDLEYLKKKPYFSRLFEKGSRVEKVQTVYPAATHPVHASIITGCYPDRTGVPHNTRFVPGKSGSWFNYLKELNVPTIFHAAKEKGLTTCACRWPVTAGEDAAIDWLVPEIIDDYTGDDPGEPFRQLGTREDLLQEIVLPLVLKQDPNAPRHPAYDTLEIECAAEIIRRYQPNLLFTHPGHVDSTRHATGLFNNQVNEALDLTEEHLGMLMRAAEDAGIYDDTDFVVLSDHGQMEIKRILNLNVLMAEAGFIRTNENGDLLDWDAFIQSVGFSAHVMLRDPNDEELKARVHEFLLKLRDEEVYAVSRVYTAEEAKAEYHLAGDFSFVLESDGFTSFGEAWTRPLIRPIDNSDYRYGNATHGHAPERGPQPPFLCMGPDFKTGVVIQNGKIVDETATLAKAMGLSMPDIDGECMDELLK